MNVYALFPLFATIVYIPLLAMTIISRPWQKRNLLFIAFLASAMTWSLLDYMFRGNVFPNHTLLIWNLTLISYPVMAVQFYQFISSFFGPGKGRWLWFAYGALACIFILAIFGYIGEGYHYQNDRFYPQYGFGILFIAVPVVMLATRSFIVLWNRLKSNENPVLCNQLISLLVALGVLTVFTLTTMLPWGREIPISHIGAILVGFILSYAVLRHDLIDIRMFLRKGAAWMTFAIIGIVAYWLLVLMLHFLTPFPLDMTTMYAGTGVAVLVVCFLFKIRGNFFELVTRAFEGSRYDIRRRLDEFTDRIHNVFSLKEQGNELINLLIRSINVTQACLMFPEAGSEDYTAQFSESRGKHCELDSFRLKAGDLIISHLKREHSPLLRDDLETLPAFLGMWAQEREEIKGRDISMFVPLISRDQLIAILVLGPKVSGRFTLEDFNIISDVTNRVAVSMEKEYLREQLREREEELSVINNSSVILSSSLDIQEIFGSFIEELKKVVEVTWASIVLDEDGELVCRAVSAPENAEYKVGDVIPLEGSGVGWVLANRKLFLESDLEKDHYFNTAEGHLRHGLRTLVYLPLIAKGRIIGCFIVASAQPNTYNHRHIKLLEQLASQIAMPLENTQLYARAEKKARVDEMTGLLNRRSLDEMLDNEISRHSRYGGEFSLAILDLDNFKAYNDTYGHLSGDALLRDIGARIKASIRTADSAFRYGGDEFAIVLPQTDIEAATQVAERVGRRIAANTNSGDIGITASIGIAVWPHDGISHSDIITAADITLYHAKRQGGNRTIAASSVTESEIVIDTLGSRVRSGDEKVLDVAAVLAQTVDDKNRLARDHSLKVGEYALVLGRELGLGAAELDCLQTSALLHDIGKLAIAEEILNKTGELTPEERETMKGHCRTGASIVGNIPQVAHCREAVRHHHESYDGSGYPDGLRGAAIPVQARILNIANAFAVLTDNSIAEPLSPGRALDELKKNAGKKFDPELVAVFVTAYEKQHPGTKHQVRR
jgi:diguanylate cyclase (GGDEF)-like protein/putative nucleotidyltransferase with HDIG domain